VTPGRHGAVEDGTGKIISGVALAELRSYKAKRQRYEQELPRWRAATKAQQHKDYPDVGRTAKLCRSDIRLNVLLKWMR